MPRNRSVRYPVRGARKRDGDAEGDAFQAHRVGAHKAQGRRVLRHA